MRVSRREREPRPCQTLDIPHVAHARPDVCTQIFTPVRTMTIFWRPQARSWYFSPVPRLLWFTAIDRRVVRTRPRPQAIDDLVRILHEGLDVPTWECRTKQNELLLGITPHRVYAYLGRTNEDLGPNAIVVDADAFSGQLSPFDTGGLVAHIKPVAEGSDADKRAYLASLTWELSDLATLLNKYPSFVNPHLKQYLDGVRAPNYDGPHVVLGQGLPHAIWRNPEAVWSWWTWEVRSQRIDVARLFAWTCTPGDYADIIRRAETIYPDPDWIVRLEGTYRQGGTGFIVEELRALQAA